jgi:hypothetical protein
MAIGDAKGMSPLGPGERHSAQPAVGGRVLDTRREQRRRLLPTPIAKAQVLAVGFDLDLLFGYINSNNRKTGIIPRRKAGKAHL